MTVALILGQIYNNDKGGSEIYWCDNYNGRNALRHIANIDVLNGVFDNTPSVPVDTGSAPINGTLYNLTCLAKDADTGVVYLIDYINNLWVKRSISSMDVFHQRHFNEGEIATVPAAVLLGVADGPDINS